MNECGELWESILFVQSQMLEKTEAAAMRVLSSSSHTGILHHPQVGPEVVSSLVLMVWLVSLSSGEQMSWLTLLTKKIQPLLRNASSSTLHAERVPCSRDDGEPVAAAGQ